MFLKDISIFNALTRNMEWLSARQKVLSRNIANADTPGFVARDLEKLSFRDLVHQPNNNMRTARTSGMHIAPNNEATDGFRREKVGTLETTPNENTVVLEDEIMKVNENRMAYDLAASIYRKHVQMLKMAIGGRGGGG
ncbi:MAG: flagellar basal body rod protein FlgB [Minwuia sp.]|uniref:flagellar basal body rod protein FlgB n=1 Tax=Minwuia sp. TaxID=2493630 RepID=UPI003A8B6793